jgi:hypothetical protein
VIAVTLAPPIQLSASMLRGERLIRNQLFVREVNARVHSAARQLGGSAGDPAQHFEIFCECSRKSCFDRIPLSVSEYEELRSDPTAFAVVPGHELPSIEQVVERNERFLTVRKFHPESIRIAAESGTPTEGSPGPDRKFGGPPSSSD